MPCQICTPNARNLVLAPSTGSGLFRTFCTISLYASTLSDSSWAACLYNSSADCCVLSCSPGVWLQGSAPPPASSALPGPSLFASSCSASAMLWLAASRARSRPRATMDPARGLSCSPNSPYAPIHRRFPWPLCPMPPSRNLLSLVRRVLHRTIPRNVGSASERTRLSIPFHSGCEEQRDPPSTHARSIM